MLFLVKSALIVFPILFCGIHCVDVLDGCNELLLKDPSRLTWFHLNQFDNNLSKSYEVFRLKMVYRGHRFVFGMRYNNNETYMVFGPHAESFGVYKSAETYDNETEPCSVRGSKSAFGFDRNTPVEAILTKGKVYEKA